MKKPKPVIAVGLLLGVAIAVFLLNRAQVSLDAIAPPRTAVWPVSGQSSLPMNATPTEALSSIPNIFLGSSLANQGEEGMVQSAKEAVMSYIKAMGDRDYATARNYLGDNVRVKGPGGEVFRSPDEFLKMMEQQRGQYDIKKVFADGSDVCLLYDFITPKVTTFFCSWYQLENGKISSIQTVFDPRAFAAT